MKNKDRIKLIVYPLVLGVVCLAIAIGLIFYYRSKDNSTPISYVMCLILGGVGIACMISGFIQIFSMSKYKKIKEYGKERKAKFISYETKSSIDKQAMYNVTFEYLDNEDTKTYISPNEFTWQEVLALKCAKEVDVKEYNGRCILINNMDDLILRYSKEIAQEQAKYDEAFNKVQDVLNTKVEGVQERAVTSVEKKKEKTKIEEEDRPDTQDDVQ